MSAAPPWWRAASLAERRTLAVDGPVPAWWDELEATLPPGGRATVPDEDDAVDADPVRGALRVAGPFARRVHHALRDRPGGIAAAARGSAQALAEELLGLLLPTVAAELVLLRALEAWPVEEVQARAAAAMRALATAERARELLEEHPALARLLVRRCELAQAAGLELQERLAADRGLVAHELFGGEDPGAAAEVVLGGDAHDGGRQVALVTFASGARAVLKPRPMRADAAWSGLLDAVTALGFSPGFASLRTVEAGPRHGWQAWAQTGSCTSPAELDRYFRRLGGQLALLHALQATDIHQENVLACGEHPHVIDLETVLHPRLGGEEAGRVDPLIAETAPGCVVRVGLLPRSDVAFGVDISGLGRDPGQAHRAEELVWTGTGADRRLEQQWFDLEAGPNAPRLHDVPVAPADHVDAFEAGYADAHLVLVEHREALLAPRGALNAFTQAEVRVVLRPTRVYGRLLRRQERDLGGLQDGEARLRALDVLDRGAARRPELAAAAPAERADLLGGDVPKVTTAPGDPDGRHHRLGRLPGMFAVHPPPGPEVVRALDDADLARQRSFLRSSVLAAAPGRPAAPVPGLVLDGVAALAARLDTLALRDGPRAGWLAPAEVPPAAGRVLRPLGPGLVDGQAGVVAALALAPAAAVPAGLLAAAVAQLETLLVELNELVDPDPRTLQAVHMALTLAGGAPPQQALAAVTSSELHPPPDDATAGTLARLARSGEDLAPTLAGPVLFAGGAESPTLAHGLAGVLLGHLAHAGSQPARSLLAAAG